MPLPGHSQGQDHLLERDSCQSNTRTALRVSPLFVESVQEVGFAIVALKTASGTTTSIPISAPPQNPTYLIRRSPKSPVHFALERLIMGVVCKVYVL